MKIVLATHNQHKMEELSAVLEDLDLQVLTLDDFPEITEIEETGNTLLENSLLKARTVFERTGLPALGDDTGLEVDALNGAPGVYSARYAGESATYEDNWKKLLDELKDIHGSNRTARFHTVISLVDENRELWTEGVVEGLITTEPRGNNGFGYDPVFLIPELQKTFAELSAREKNSRSHRGNALRNLCKLLQDQFILSQSKVKREEPTIVPLLAD